MGIHKPYGSPRLCGSNDQMGRITSLKTRGAVAFFGDLGYELDITKMAPTELDQSKNKWPFINVIASFSNWKVLPNRQSLCGGRQCH